MSAIAIVDRVETAINLGESHFREFKSALEGAPNEKVKRKTKDISVNISQTLVAFANADGGELLVGVEDNGEITGLTDFSDSEIGTLSNSYVSHVHSDTPLANVRRHLIEIKGKKILYFSVPKSVQYVHVTSDGRCMQRKDLESVPVSAESVQFDRSERRSREYDREFVDGVSADDLNLDLVRIVSDQILKGMSVEKCLQYLELGEYGLSRIRLRRAALLLFSKNPMHWHPRLQVRILKVDGESLLTGEDYNVVSDQLISENILNLIDSSWEALRPHLVQTRFEKSGRFEQRSIYPEMACREALLNAVAHRDYSDEGRGIEVYVYNNRLDILSPGGLLSSIKIDDIVNQRGVHQSRNTHVSRVLRELGYMRELGEGMRRIFELMHKNELAPPVLNNQPGSFSISLSHSPLYSGKDLIWLNQFDQFDLDREQKAIVLLGRDDNIFSAQDVWDAVGIVDTEHYRRLVDSLMKLSILSARVEKSKAKSLARRRRIPYREYPRYGISVPSSRAFDENSVRTAPVEDNSIEDDEVKIDSRRIWVGGLPSRLSKASIFDAFSKFGEIIEINLPMVYSGRSKGFCFIEFQETTAAEKAISTDGVEFEGRVLAIRPARPRP